MNINNAKGSNPRVHFKNTRETWHAIKVGLIACVLHATTALTLIYIKGVVLKKAQAYLQHVVEHKEAVAFRRFCGGVGRTSQVCKLVAHICR